MKLEKGAHIHLMGICGTAMASLAGILQSKGYRVTGSDTNVYPPMSTQLEKLGIPIMEGYKKENLDPAPDLVIVGNVIMKKYEEAQFLLSSSIPYTSLPKAMAEYVIEDRESIVLTGTHGKTTSTSLMAWLADYQKKKPGFLVGGIPVNFGSSFRAPEDDFFVIEGDEYDTAFFDKVPKFIYYKPKHVILTSIEFDHADIYQDLDDIKKAFTRLLQLIPDDGNLVYNGEDDEIFSILNHSGTKNIASYGLEAGDHTAKNLEMGEEGIEFNWIFKGEDLGRVRSPLYGRYNVMNILGVLALSHSMGWPVSESINSLHEFKGVKRRQEYLGCPNGVHVIEDFAHHPTAVGQTILAVGERYQGKRVFNVFEPRSATSRRAIFQDEYVDALSLGQDILLVNPDDPRIPEEERLKGENLVKELNQKGRNAKLFSGPREIVDHLKQETEPGDVVLVMSNGAFGGIYQMLLGEL